MISKLKIWILPVLWASLIFFVSSIPSVKVTDDTLFQQILNYGGHFTEYAVLTLLLIKPLKSIGKLSQRNLFLLPFIYSLSDELHQFFVPGRMADLKDILVDMLGIVTIIWIVKRKGELE